MKILYLISGLRPGGAENNLKEIITKLPQGSFEIIVCSLTNEPGIIDEIRPFIKNLYFLNAKNYLDFFKSLIKLRKIIKKESPQIIHCFLFHANILGRLAAFNCKVKMICSIRNKLINNKIGNFIDYLTQNFVDIYTVNSKSLYKFVISYGIKRNKIKIINNLIDFNHLKPLKSKEEMKTILQLDDAPVISMIAHIRKQKDYPSVLKAIHLLAKKGLLVNFLLVGDNHIQEHETSKILKLISKLNLKNVKILGLRNDIPDILNITDIWVSSTLFEGQSNALLEAMFMKKPIITTNIPENSEVVRNEKEALLVPIRSPLKTAKAIKMLIENKDLANRLANNAYQKVCHNYDINMIVDRLERFYRLIFVEK